MTASTVLSLPSVLSGQGETTSAILGQVTDSSGAVVPGATVTITNRDTGLKRAVHTDAAGRFNFPQLLPGSYSVRAEASGFEPQQVQDVSAGLGQKQTINLALKVAQSKETVEVSSQASIINPTEANTTTTLNAPALENLPNPGGDLTYPLQFAAGALINTAGSGNDFVGGTNGYGNVEFNGLPALSNGYIVDGLETNDPLTNLNSGLSTNLVLGLNSISEVTVNTLSYSVDQGRYGASQVNYVTKSGTNQFHGNLYELWNGSVMNAADYFTNATPGNHKPFSNVNHFGGSLGGPIIHDKLFFFFDGEWVRIALPIYSTITVPTPAFQQYVLQQLPLGGTDSITGVHYAPAPELVPFYQKMFSLYGSTSGTPFAVLGCPFNVGGSAASGTPPNGNGCANRMGVSHSSDDHEQVQTARIDYNINANNTTWFRFQADTGLQAAYTDPINPIFNSFSPQPLYSFAAGYTHIFSQESGQLFQSGVLVVLQHLRAEQFRSDARGISHRAAGRRSQRPVHHHRRARQHLAAGPERNALLHQRQSGMEPRRARISLRHQHPNLSPERLRLWRGYGAHGDLHRFAAIHLRCCLDCYPELSRNRPMNPSTSSTSICMRRTPGE